MELLVDILTKINEKGWHVYPKSNYGPKDTIKNMPAEFLRTDQKYVLLPMTDEPGNPDKVFNELEILAISLNREVPTITIYDCPFPVVGFTVNKQNIKVHTTEGYYISEAQFYDALDTIVETRYGINNKIKNK